ncbi:MAG: circularly permuted type 2 ATP-grasp protein [Prosthecobacter sp.]|uniref:circularly permuted type 2 ATP-grasp protein n=1 Tax=Prosthecobacter sp. TaxID=1965333 RepID=UPI0019E4CB3C|nr:circularly permuted type 2 ATP-grasp protein [Prosthecobacter sp.]MBE2282221.1 circularly permuted type 2 ATP-grasp protein [Prosthecobacter sp.]
MIFRTQNSASTAPAAARAAASCADLTGVKGHYDELRDDSAKVRAHYEALVADLKKRDAAGVKRLSDTARRLLAERGVSFNVYNAKGGMDTPWMMDPVPFVISAKEWEGIEKALIQRATLLNAVLVDSYGPQQLIKRGDLPAALVLAQPAYLRPCHGIPVPGEKPLQVYGADIARSPDGQWWVIADRTQIPTGAGYALENRLITSRLLPEVFRDARVRRLAGFFRQMQQSLAALAPRRVEEPRVVLLTPGPYNETYFEQAYLARYLGYTLVEGEDLTVRDDRVYLKTLSGLEPVDVILRRVDDDFCDPLELRNDSMLGVPGLVRAVRAGNVALANALGSGLAEAPAMMAFLPGLCRKLLNEDLLMPSVATWWCGQETPMREVEQRISSLVFKSAFRVRGREVHFGGNLSATEHAALLERMRFAPHRWAAQEKITFSTAPTWEDGKLVHKPVSVRVYLVATPDGYMVMPGALTRVASSLDSPLVSMQKGGSSKDTWVLSDGPVENVTLLSATRTPVELRRVGHNLGSRVANHLFWLGRYAERAESTARLLRSTLLRCSPESGMSETPLLLPLLEALRSLGIIEQVPSATLLAAQQEQIEARLLQAIFDADHPSSIRSNVAHIQRIGVLLRDRISVDTWRVISQLSDALDAADNSASVTPMSDALNVLTRIILELASFHGLAKENMTRAQGWMFLDMGHRIERTVYISELLLAGLRSADAENPSLLEAILEVGDSTITYRNRYSLLPQLAAVYDLLMLDELNPRGLRFQFQRIEGHFRHLPREQNSALLTPAMRVLIENSTRLQLCDPTELARVEPGQWSASQVAKLLQQLIDAMPALSDAMSAGYFAHSTISSSGDVAPADPAPPR